MKFEINKRFIVLKVEEKQKVNLYTLIDVDNGDKLTSIGLKEKGFENRDLVDVTLVLKVQSEKIDTKSNGIKFIETVNIFISKISKVVK